MVAALIISVLLSALSLAVDAFAVSVCDGMTFRNLNKLKAASIPLTFGIFQAVMPIIGFYVGALFTQFEKFDDFDHWIAFVLLAVLGAKMIFDGVKELKTKQAEEIEVKNFSYANVLVQGVATSIAFFRLYPQHNDWLAVARSALGVAQRFHNRRCNLYNFAYGRNHRRKGGQAV